MTGNRTMRGATTLAFNEDDGEGSIKVTETFPEAHGIECLFVVQFADARGHLSWALPSRTASTSRWGQTRSPGTTGSETQHSRRP